VVNFRPRPREISLDCRLEVTTENDRGVSGTRANEKEGTREDVKVVRRNVLE